MKLRCPRCGTQNIVIEQDKFLCYHPGCGWAGTLKIVTSTERMKKTGELDGRTTGNIP